MSRIPVLLFLPLLTGCASIVSKSSWPVTLKSDPPGALVSIVDEDGAVVHSGTTPLTTTLSAKEGFFSRADYTVQATLSGYAPVELDMKARLNPWYWGNIVFGGLIGLLIVDPATGAMWKLRDELTIQFTPQAPMPQP